MELNTPTWVQDRFNDLNDTSLSKLRQDAIGRIEKSGFPTTKLEDWKYTNIANLLKTNFKPAQDTKATSLDSIKKIGTRLVFVNGKLIENLSELDKLSGVNVCSLAKAISENSDLVSKHLGQYAQSESGSFVALNNALVSDGVLIHCKENSEQPIEIVYYSSGDDVVINPRMLLIASENSKVKIIERFIGQGSYLNNYVAEIVLGKNARIDHYKIQEESEKSSHFSRIEARQESGSNYQNHAFNFGAKLSRNEINPTLQGENAYSLLHGLNILSSDQHVDNQTVLDHAKPNCDSREWYKGIYSDNSKGVFSGTIIVRQDAQKTNAFQSNQSLLLSENAESNSKPQLKIWADDVKCSHGATVGQLDQDAMFYLRSRGVPKKVAESILITAFARDILEPIEIDELKEEIEQKILAKLTF